MSLATAAAEMPVPPAQDEDVIGTTQESQGGDATFEGSLKDDVHSFICVDVKSKRTANKFKPGEMRDQAVFLLAVKGDESKGNLAWYTSFSLHEKSHLPDTYKAFGLAVPAAGTPLRKSEFVGKAVRGFTKNEQSKDGTKTFPRIKSLLGA